MNTHLPYWLAAFYLPNIGPRKLMQWLEYFPDIESLFQASHDELKMRGISNEHISLLQQPNWEAIEKDMRWAEADNHRIITLEDKAYPKLLKEIAAPPLILFVSGNVSILSDVQIAIVGSRQASYIGLKNAESFAYALTEFGITVTSGLALGIDGASHRGALAAKGRTIAVCGTGLNHTYPRSHQSLIEKIIAQQGAVLSEFPLDMQAYPKNFPQRNRIISGMSMGVLVVEAALKSGSLITAKYASEQGREVFAIPGSIQQLQSRGCHQLIRQGAKLVETVADIFEELDGFKKMIFEEISEKQSTKKSIETLESLHKQVFEQIRNEITAVDVILLRTGLTTSEVSSILLSLELEGYIHSVPGGYIRCL